MERKRTKRQNREISVFPEPDFLPAIDKDKKKWRGEFVREVFFLTLLGATDKQIAQTFGIGTTTLDYWKRTKPDFLESLNKGKTMADAKVAHSLYLAAVGYSHPDQVVLSNKIKEFGENGKIKREYTEPLIVKTIKSYPPNVTAAVKWLKARKPEMWGDKLEVKGNITMHHQVDLSKFSTEELEVLNKLGVEDQDIQDITYEDLENSNDD